MRFLPGAVLWLLLCSQTSIAYSQTIVGQSFTSNQLQYWANQGQLLDTDGQPRPDILFYTGTRGMKIYFRKTGVSYVFESFGGPGQEMEADSQKLKMHRVDLEFEGSQGPSEIILSPAGGPYRNYYLAHCPEGILKVRGIERVVYKNLYPGIDWILYLHHGQLKYDLMVHPGARPEDIQIRVTGADAIHLDSLGNLVLLTTMGTVTESRPQVFQAGEPVPACYTLNGDWLSFDIGAYDPNRDLTIDPDRAWATYLGGSDADEGDGGAATDLHGNVYVQGSTRSTDFPVTAGAFQTTFGGGTKDIYLGKFSPNGNQLWVTYYGGTASDYADSEEGVSTDPWGHVYIAGVTSSSDFPVTAGAFQTIKNVGADVYLVKFDSTGTRKWATFYGGDGHDRGSGGCATDRFGNVFIHGRTESSFNFPVSAGAFQTTFGGGSDDAFIAKFDSTGGRIWGTYLGGSDYDEGKGGCAVDTSGNIFVHGYTGSSNFPVSPGAFQPLYAGNRDSYVAKFDAAGNRLWATFLGGTEDDSGQGGCDIDPSMDVIVHGHSRSTDFPVTQGAFQATRKGTNNPYDAYITKLSGSAGDTIWSTYYGGTDTENGRGGCAVDTGGNVFVFGYTTSADFPVTPGAFQTNHSGISDCYLVKLDPTGNQDWATYYGSSGFDLGSGGCAVDSGGNVFFHGYTYGSNFPVTAGAFQTVPSGNTTSFLVKFNGCSSPQPVCQNITVELDTTGIAVIVPSQIENGSILECGLQSMQVSPDTFDCSNLGVNVVTLTITDNNGTSASCTADVTVVDLIPPTVSCPGPQSGVTDINCRFSLPDYTSLAISSDNCSSNLTLSQNPLPGTVIIGAGTVQTVELTVSDASGNTATCSFTVTLLDIIPPSINCPASQLISVDSVCNAYLPDYTVTVIHNDNCDPNPVITQNPLPGTLLGAVGSVQLITLSITDINGNSGFCNFTTVVIDDRPPDLICLGNQTAYLDSNCQYILPDYRGLIDINDNCDTFPALTQSPPAGTLLSGAFTQHTISFSALDKYGNFNSCSFELTLLDTVKPDISCPGNQVLSANLNCQAILPDYKGLANELDNCISGVQVSQNPPAGTVISGLTQTTRVTLIATDPSGNKDSCSFDVSLTDREPPVLVCMNNVSGMLDTNCTYIVPDFRGNLSVADNCDQTPSIQQNPQPGTPISNPSSPSIDFLITDASGNTSSCGFQIILLDTIRPIVKTQNRVLYLDATGSGTLSASDVDAGTSDNCATVQLSVSPVVFSCADTGTNPVWLQAVDASGNTAGSWASVLVLDTVPPVTVCRDTVLYLDSMGNASINGGLLGIGSSDNCGPITFMASQTVFNCLDTGKNSIQLLVTDASGRTSACNVQITVLDTLPPLVIGRDTTLYLDINGIASVNAMELDKGSIDNCGQVSLTLSDTVFNCTNTGFNTVLLTGTDLSGNQSEINLSVTVMDTLIPSAVCQDITVYLDSMGEVSINPTDVDGGSSDNCGLASKHVGPDTFNNNHIGANPVTLTVTDLNGNTNSCASVVTVIDSFPVGMIQTNGQNTGPITWMEVYPNPSTDRLHIIVGGLEGRGKLDIEILNILGMKIWGYSGYRVSGYETSVNLLNQASGQYLIRVRTGNSILVRKFILLR